MTAVGFANIVERRHTPPTSKSVRFSVATNGKFTVATNSLLFETAIIDQDYRAVPWPLFQDTG